MPFKAERNFDMSQFGWTDCKFTFNALTWGEMRSLDKSKQEWTSKTDPKDIEKAANDIIDIVKAKFVRGEALDEDGNKIAVKKEDFENLPFDIMLKLNGWLMNGEVDGGFLASSTTLSKTTPV